MPIHSRRGACRWLAVSAFAIAAAFAGQNTVKRHRLIHAAVGDLMHGRIHALSIRAFSPDEV